MAAETIASSAINAEVIASSAMRAVVIASSAIFAVVTASSAILAVATALLAILAEVTALPAILSSETALLTSSVVFTVFPANAVDSVTFPDPSKETALAVTSPDNAKSLAFARAVAEDTVPVRLPMKVPATNVSLPTVHLPALSSQTNVLLLSSPLSTSIPASSVPAGVPVWSEFSVIILSPMFTVFELTVVVVPDTVRLPPIARCPENVAVSSD